MRKNAGFNAIAVLILALGIGATTTIFSVIDGWILRKPPVRDAKHFVVMSSTNPKRAFAANRAPVSAPDYLDWREHAAGFMDMAAADFAHFTITGSGMTPEFVRGARVSATFFLIAGVEPILGRPILRGEDMPGDDRVVVLGEALWRGQFAGDRTVLGRMIKINGNPYTIVGVMPDGFLTWDFDAQIWIPLAFSHDEIAPERRTFRFLRVFARLQPGISMNQAGAQMKTIAERIAKLHVDTNKGWGASVMLLQQYSIADSNAAAALVFLMATVCFVLLIVCVNLAGLLLARNAKRREEFSIRAALGASRLRLGRQLLSECLLMTLPGGILGALFAFLAVRAVAAQLNWNEGASAMAKALSVDARVLTFTMAVSILAALLSGLVPAVHVSQSQLTAGLKEGGRGSTTGHHGLRLRRLLVVGQLALSLILLVGAGLFVEGFVQEMRANVGFNPSNVLTASVSLRGPEYYGSPQREAAFFQDVLRRVTSSPQVESAAVASNLPFSFPDTVQFTIEGHPESQSAEEVSCGHFVVSPGYFKALQIPLLRGREFAQSDTPDSAPVAVVDQAFASKYFPNVDAVGRHILIRSAEQVHNQWSEIVGVVGNVNEFLGQVHPRAHIFEPFRARASGTMSFVVRTRVEPSGYSDSLRRSIWAVDADQAVTNVKTMDRVIADSGEGDNIMAELMGGFAVIALTIAAIGIYGVLSFFVSLRTHEIGVRLAIGAQPREVLGMVMRSATILIGTGVTIGILVSLMLPKVVRSAFNDFQFSAPRVFGLTFLTVIVIAVVACWVPARRAMRVDPIVALRHE